MVLRVGCCPEKRLRLVALLCLRNSQSSRVRAVYNAIDARRRFIEFLAPAGRMHSDLELACGDAEDGPVILDGRTDIQGFCTLRNISVVLRAINAGKFCGSSQTRFTGNIISVRGSNTHVAVHFEKVEFNNVCLQVGNNATVVMNRCLLRDCITEAQEVRITQPGVTVYGGASLICTDCEIRRCESGIRVCLAANERLNVLLIRCKMVDNRYGIEWIRRDPRESTVVLDNCIFEHNSISDMHTCDMHTWQQVDM